jgi:tetratricopeptide (TPR) repeat protein
VYYYLGQAALLENSFRAAKENFEKCLSLAPSKLEMPCSDILIPVSHRGLAQVHRALGEYDQAVAALTKGLESPGVHGWLLYGLSEERGNLCTSQKKYAAAVIDFDRMEELAFGQMSWHIYKRRGLAHFYLKHYEQALADIAKAVELRPIDVSNLTWIPLGEVASCPDEKFRTGFRALVDKTIRFLKSTPDFDKGQGHAANHNKLAWLLATCPDLQVRNPGQAVAHAQKAVEVAPDNGMFWNTLGVAQYRNGDWKAAIEALMKSVQLGKGGDSFDFFFLAMAHWQQNDKDKARDWYDRAVAWMDKNDPQNKELKRFRAEATSLLGLAKAAETQKKKE